MDPEVTLQDVCDGLVGDVRRFETDRLQKAHASLKMRIERRQAKGLPDEMLTLAKKLKLSIKDELSRRAQAGLAKTEQSKRAEKAELETTKQAEIRRERAKKRAEKAKRQAAKKPPQIAKAAAPCCSEGVGGKASAVPGFGGGGAPFTRQSIAAAAAH